ncbi:uncharacterized protein RHO17_007716 [Thomomys bottae]
MGTDVIVNNGRQKNYSNPNLFFPSKGVREGERATQRLPGKLPGAWAAATCAGRLACQDGGVHSLTLPSRPGPGSRSNDRHPQPHLGCGPGGCSGGKRPHWSSRPSAIARQRAQAAGRLRPSGTFSGENRRLRPQVAKPGAGHGGYPGQRPGVEGLREHTGPDALAHSPMAATERRRATPPSQNALLGWKDPSPQGAGEACASGPYHLPPDSRLPRRSPDVQAKEELWKHIQKELVDPSGLSEEQLKEIPYTKIERSPDVQAKEELWKHIQKELVDPSGLSEEQLKEIPYTKIETQADPVCIRHSHSSRSYRQY